MRVFAVLVFSFLAWLLLGFGTVASVGYGLYTWAVLDVAFKMALWTTFITWIKLAAAGVVSFIIAATLGATL